MKSAEILNSGFWKAKIFKTVKIYNFKLKKGKNWKLAKIWKSAKILNSGLWKAKILKSIKILNSGLWKDKILKSARIFPKS